MRPPAPYLWPVVGGYVTDLYGHRTHPITKAQQFHNGLDIGKGEGAPILAPADGVVSVRSDDATQTSGRYIVLKHDDGWSSSYLHLLTSPVTKGARVKRGQVIGLMGSTGRSTAPHLHWIVRDANESVVDPLVTLTGSFPKKGGGSVKGKYSGFPWKPVFALAGGYGLYRLWTGRPLF